ncbi:MAG: mucoidy inhibitor MuiA family protein [Syntrophobacterales bacterium]|nr:mucoidy inhibitor MuiA family protein [Syntrophobacterales bacterium]
MNFRFVLEAGLFYDVCHYNYGGNLMMHCKRYAIILLWTMAAALLTVNTAFAAKGSVAPAADTVKMATTTKVTAIEIYPAGAKAVFSAQTGENVTIEIPGAFDERTVRAIKKPGQTIRYFRVQRVHNPGFVPNSLKDLFREIEDKKDRIKVLDAQIQTAAANQELLNNIPISDKMNAAEVGILLNNVMQQRSRLSLELTRLKGEKEKLSTEVSQLTEKYKRNLPPKYDSVISVNVGAAGAGTVDVEALTTHASWIPKYDMNFNTKNGDITSKMVAETRMNSGIAYEGAVKFYTNQPPSASLAVPKINRLVVTFPPEYKSDSSSKRAYANQMMAAEMAAPAPQAVMMDEPRIIVAESPVNAVITGNGRIISDNMPVSIELGSVTYRAKPSVLMYRDFSRTGLLMAHIDSLKEPVLPGAATMYVDDQFSGYTSVAYTGRGQSLKLAVGYAPLIKINKETDAGHSSTGFFSSGITQGGYSLEAANGSSMDLDIELIDRIPFSVDDKIVVEAITINPTPDKNEDNVLTWKFHLKKGESKKFKVQYRIKHPADKELIYR